MEIYKINKKELTLNLNNAKVNNKVYDATNIATFEDGAVIAFNEAPGDGTGVDISKIILTFNETSIGVRKVTVDASKALVGDFAKNYTIKTAVVENVTIFPYAVSVEIPNFGVVSVYNRRGAMNPELAGLLPLDAFLEVEAIYGESGAYAEIFDKIEDHISRTNTFVVGYKFSLIVNGEKRGLDNNLHLSIHNVEDLTKVLAITENGSQSVAYKVEDGEIVIDLLNMPEGYNALVLTQHKPLLKLWQILLISIGGVVLIGGAVTTIVIVRIKRKRKAEEIDFI